MLSVYGSASENMATARVRLDWANASARFATAHLKLAPETVDEDALFVPITVLTPQVSACVRLNLVRCTVGKCSKQLASV